MTEELPQHIKNEMHRQMNYHFPNECCGYLWVGASGAMHIFPVSNVSKNPEHEFEMDQAEQIAAHMAASMNVVGVYHSHPRGPATPSHVDLKFAPPGLRYFVVSPQGIHEHNSQEVS